MKYTLFGLCVVAFVAAIEASVTRIRTGRYISIWPYMTRKLATRPGTSSEEDKVNGIVTACDSYCSTQSDADCDKGGHRFMDEVCMHVNDMEDVDHDELDEYVSEHWDFIECIHWLVTDDSNFNYTPASHPGDEYSWYNEVMGECAAAKRGNSKKELVNTLRDLLLRKQKK